MPPELWLMPSGCDIKMTYHVPNDVKMTYLKPFKTA